MFRLLTSALGIGLLGTALVFAPSSSLAEEGSLEDFGGSDFDSAFDDFDTDVPDAELSEQKQEFLEITGTLGFETAYNYDSRAPVIVTPPDHKANWHGFSKARFDGRLQADFYFPREWKGRLSGTAFYDRIYAIHGRTDYSTRVLRDQEIEYEIAEAYLQGSVTSFLDLKAGRQIVIGVTPTASESSTS